MNLRKITAIIMAALVISSFSACGSGNSGENYPSEPVKLLDSAEMFSGRDVETSYDESECTVITLSGNSTSVKGDGAKADGNSVTITAA